VADGKRRFRAPAVAVRGERAEGDETMTRRDAARKEERRSRVSIRAALALLTTALAPSLA
jgi:hypothetical protein